VRSRRGRVDTEGVPASRTRLRAALVVSLAACLGLSALPAASAAEDRRRPPLLHRVLFGSFLAEPGNPTRPVSTADGLASYEASIGADVQIVSRFYGFGDVFPGAAERELADRGRRAVLLSWDMGDARAQRFAAWRRGDHDRYLRRVGRAMAAYPYPIFVRPWPEMNADWVPFQPTASGSKRAGGTPKQFRRAWRHVISVVQSVGATNVQWVFNPTADVYQQTTHVKRIFPGPRWVDVLGIDGYNWGNIPRWRSFRNVFQAQYRRLARLPGRLPMWVCEFGSTEPRIDDGSPLDPQRSKGRWLARAFSSERFPRIHGLVHFDAAKERDWRFSSSTEALRATRRWMASRPEPGSDGSRAAVGVARLAPTLRASGGTPVISWGRSADPRTTRYEVQRRWPNGRWRTLVRTTRIAWRPPPVLVERGAGRAWYRIRGLDSDSAPRWTSTRGRLS
jgi:hypothetical protein